MSPPEQVIKFDYNTFYQFYKNIGIPVEDVHFREYTGKKYESKDKDKNKEKFLREFKMRNVQIYRIPDSDYIVQSNSEHFEYGAFISAPLDSKKKMLYIVNPVLKAHKFGAEPFLLCNHLSFILERTDKKQTPLHFHQTVYLPTSLTTGKTTHHNNYLPSTFSYSTSTFANLITHDDLQQIVGTLYNIFTYPWRGIISSQGLHGAGTGTARSKPPKRRVQVREAQPVIPAHSKRFLKLWEKLPLKRIVVMAIPSPQHPELMDVTVVLYDRLRHKPDTLRPAIHLQVPKQTVENHRSLEVQIAEKMKHFTYDGFRDPEEYYTEEEESV
jgi:hypothetical protein